MRVILSRPALSDLDDMLAFIAARSRLAAAHVAANMRRAFDHIAGHPEATLHVEARPHVLRLPLMRHSYVIYYEIAYDAVTVLRILHRARQQAAGDEGKS